MSLPFRFLKYVIEQVAEVQAYEQEYLRPSMKLEHFLNSRAGIAIGLGLSSAMPLRLGYFIARWLAELIARRHKNAMVRAVAANQWVVHDCKPGRAELEQLVINTFRSTGRSLFEFWHFFRSPDMIRDFVRFDKSFQDMIDRAKRAEQGTLLVAPHMSNFDLIGRATVLAGLELHILSFPQPPGGYRWQNELREMRGLKVTPMSIEALRDASETLRNNGTVVTGVDRPLPTGEDAKYRPRFFGKAAALPVFHIRLAQKFNIPITVLGGCRQSDGRYLVWATDPIPMVQSDDLVEEIVINAEAVLAAVETVVRKSPQQWAMFYPVWPETLEQVQY